jgi:Fe-S-cluster containining protein
MECCKVVTFDVPLYTGTLEFYKARGLKTVYVNKHIVKVVVPHVCKQLTDKGCMIYSQRPLACKLYDGTKDFILKDKCLWGKEE